MEEEVFDSANDNYNYLWPRFDTAWATTTLRPIPTGSLSGA